MYSHVALASGRYFTQKVRSLKSWQSVIHPYHSLGIFPSCSILSVSKRIILSKPYTKNKVREKKERNFSLAAKFVLLLLLFIEVTSNLKY